MVVSCSNLNKLPPSAASIRQGPYLGGGKLPTGQWLEEIAYQHWNVLDIVSQDTDFSYLMWILATNVVHHNMRKELLSKA